LLSVLASNPRDRPVAGKSETLPQGGALCSGFTSLTYCGGYEGEYVRCSRLLSDDCLAAGNTALHLFPCGYPDPLELLLKVTLQHTVM
jgi:hypothetical protein